jgi:type III secretory pathway lipoprotein EscJ
VVARSLHQLSVWGLFSVLMLLSACANEITLQAGLNDADPNEIMTLLQRAGLDVTK